MMDNQYTNPVQCIHCKESFLDTKPECMRNMGHEVDNNLLNNEVNVLYNEMISALSMNRTEHNALGIISESALVADTVIDLPDDEYRRIIMSDKITQQTFKRRFPNDIIRNYFTNLEAEEVKEVKEISSKIQNMRNQLYNCYEGNDTEKRNKWNVDKAKFEASIIYKKQFLSKFPIEFMNQIIDIRDNIEEKIRKVVYGGIFKIFVDFDLTSFLRDPVNSNDYQTYIKLMTGINVDLQTVINYYYNYVYDTAINNQLTNKIVYFSIDSLLVFLSIHVPIYMTIDSRNKKLFFINTIIESNEMSNNSYRDFINHIQNNIRVQLLKKYKSSLCIKRNMYQYQDKYLNMTTARLNYPYNYTHSINMNNIKLRYRFLNPFKGKSGFKKTILFCGNDQCEKEVYDFLEFYTKFKPNDTLRAIVYKNGKDIRIKGDITCESKILSMQEDEMKSKINNSLDDDIIANISLNSNVEYYTAIYFSGLNADGYAIFDHSTSACYITGTSALINQLVDTFITEYNMDMSSREFISFSSGFEISTRAVLSKKILQEILMIYPLNRNWFVKNINTMANKYRFIYTPDESPKQIETNEYVSVGIEFNSKQTTTHNLWNITYIGNKQIFIIPFISMFIGLIEMMENIPYDPRFDAYIQAEQAYLQMVVKFCSSTEKSKVQDTSICQIAKHEITKREVYGNTLKETGITKLNMHNYEERSKPFGIKRPLVGSLEEKKWILFYTYAKIGINHIILDKSLIPQNLADEVEEEINIISTRFKFKTETVYEETGYFEREVFVFDDQVIGIVYNDYLFLSYPERSNLHSMGMRNGVPVRLPDYINNEDKPLISQRSHTSPQRVKEVKAVIQEMIKQFTDEKPKRMIFFEPHINSGTYREYIEEKFKPKVLRSILAQHMWDKTDDEINTDIEHLNVETQQDMLQCVMNSFIMYFDYDQSTKQYVFKLPRHNHWYAININYNRVIFIFRNKEGRHEIIKFENKEDSILMNDKVLSFFSTGIFGQQAKNIPISCELLYRLIDEDEEIAGQMFDTNGKCVGFRIKKGDKIMDLRIQPQYPLIPIMMYGFASKNNYQYVTITDSLTNVDEIFNQKIKQDTRFELIPKRTTRVRYQVSKIYEDNRQWKQMFYIFWRMVVMHWSIKTRRIIDIFVKRSVSNLIMYEDIEKYIDTVIIQRDPSRPIHETQEIETVVIPENNTDINVFESYLMRVYPNVFYTDNGVKAFHVITDELNSMREYMKRELDIIKEYPREFFHHLNNTRMNIKLIKQSSSEIIGINNITSFMTDMNIRINLLSKTHLRHIGRFVSNIDPLHYDRNSKDDKNEKSEMVTIFYKSKLYIIRLFKSGIEEVATYAAMIWHKEKRILPYDYYDTNFPSMTSRLFQHKNGEIQESTGNKNDDIEASGMDLWVLSYTRTKMDRSKNKEPHVTVYAAMLPI